MIEADQSLRHKGQRGRHSGMEFAIATSFGTV